MADEREAVHSWFGLTYANYLVVPRAVLQSMPDEWQRRFVGCLEEMEVAFGHLAWPSYEVKALAREREFITPYVECEDCDGTGRQKTEGGIDEVQEIECSYCDGDGEVEDSEGPRYETPEEVGFRTDPIQHYDRGRTRLIPRG